MIKCPKCGSTAQIEMVWQDTEVYTTEFFREFECGCGCVFEVTYTVSNTKVLNDY